MTAVVNVAPGAAFAAGYNSNSIISGGTRAAT